MLILFIYFGLTYYYFHCAHQNTKNVIIANINLDSEALTAYTSEPTTRTYQPQTCRGNDSRAQPHE